MDVVGDYGCFKGCQESVPDGSMRLREQRIEGCVGCDAGTEVNIGSCPGGVLAEDHVGLIESIRVGHDGLGLMPINCQGKVGCNEETLVY